MPRVADVPIRIRFIHTRYGHWGSRSGYPCFTQHLDPRRFRIDTHASADEHGTIARLLRPLRPWLRERLQGLPRWYKASDLKAELSAFRQCLSGGLDIVHFLDGEHGALLLPRLLRRIGSRTRTVATFHQPPDLLEELLDPAVLPLIDHLVLMSPSQRSYFEGRVPQDRISVLLHGVDTDFFHPEPHRQTSGPVRCITVGHWLRDWEVFRAVAAQTPDVEFHVVTPREIGAEHLANVHRHSGIDDQQLAELYRSADILFLPLQDSTANNTLLEGMASGLPVVTTDLPAVRAYLADAEDRYARPGDAKSHLAALRTLQGDVGLRRRKGALARARAEALSWHKVAGDYEALYAGLVRPICA